MANIGEFEGFAFGVYLSVVRLRFLLSKRLKRMGVDALRMYLQAKLNELEQISKQIQNKVYLFHVS